jgi:Relaxase/Mobilisation nuclease domain
MIIKIEKSGKSFSGLATYLTHDAGQAKTNERLAWTHTHNLANDDVPCAVDEMLWTARDAELLKQEAGFRAGGRAIERPVKHVSLNWAPGDNPTREHMIGTTEDFLRHMKWQEHQAIVVAHNDKAHAHVHIMLNAVHPETGLRLNDDFERRRAQAWALEYERAQGRIYCEQRLKNPEERESSPPRNVWMAFWINQKEFENSEKSLAQKSIIPGDEPINLENSEWQILKDIQRDERVGFFADGKSEFSNLRNSIYRKIREEFRGRWADYFTACREGADSDTLAALKAEIVADQKLVLDARREEACGALRESRDERYRELLDGQREIRAELRWGQETGLDNAVFLSEAGDRSAGDGLTEDFREAADEVTAAAEVGWETYGDEHVSPDDAPMAAGPYEGGGAGGPPGLGLALLFGAVMLDLSEFGAPPPRPKPAAASKNQFRVAAEEASKHAREREQEEADAEYRRKQRVPYGE